MQTVGTTKAKLRPNCLTDFSVDGSKNNKKLPTLFSRHKRLKGMKELLLLLTDFVL